MLRIHEIYRNPKLCTLVTLQRDSKCDEYNTIYDIMSLLYRKNFIYLLNHFTYPFVPDFNFMRDSCSCMIS